MNEKINTYTIRHHEAGPDGILRLAPLFDFFQDSAAENAEETGYGMKVLDDAGCLWVLSRIRLGITALPTIGDRVSIETYQNGTEKLFVRRQFILRDQSENILVKASSLWLVIDRKRLRPLRPESAIKVTLQRNLDKPPFFPEIGKFADLSEDVPYIGEYRIGHSQIDVNRHLNNAFYAGFVADLLGERTGAFVSPKEMQLNYLQACLPGDHLQCRGCQTEKGHWFFDGTLTATHIRSFMAEVLL